MRIDTDCNSGPKMAAESVGGLVGTRNLRPPIVADLMTLRRHRFVGGVSDADRDAQWSTESASERHPTEFL